MCVWYKNVGVCHGMHMAIQGQLVGLAFFPCVGSRNWTQVVRVSVQGAFLY